MAGHVLDRTHPVERQPGGGHDGAAGLGRHPHRVGDTGPTAGRPHRLGPLGHGGRLLAVDVGHTEATTDHELGQTERGEEASQHVDGLGERLQGEDLTAQVGVDPHELHDPCGIEVGQSGHGPGRRPRRQSEAELRVLLAGPHELVGVDLHARGDARQHPGARPGDRLGVLRTPLEPGWVGHQPLEAVDLVEGVHDDAADPDGQGRRQFLGRLVVAVQDEPVGRHAGREGHMELATGGDIEAHALFMGQLRHGDAQERLGGVGDPVAPGGHGLPTGGAQVGLVVDEQRRALVLGQFDQVAAADAEVTVGADAGRGREEVDVDRTGRDGHGHIASGACTPRSPSPMASPIREASTSHSRAWARAGSTSSARIGQSW